MAASLASQATATPLGVLFCVVHAALAFLLRIIQGFLTGKLEVVATVFRCVRIPNSWGTG